MSDLIKRQEFAKDTNVLFKDLIRRQAAIEEIARWLGYIDEDLILRIQTGLKKLPSVQPEQKTGRWVMQGTAYGCSLCGEGVIHPFHNYCPNCGARMLKGEEDE